MSAEHFNQQLLDAPNLAALRRRERALSRQKRFVYRDSGQVRVIDLKLRPRVMGKGQLHYLSRVCDAVAAVQRTVAKRWLFDERLQAALPLSDAEVGFLTPVLRSKAAHQAPTVLRLDASVSFGTKGWKEKLKLFELNSVGVGGLCLTPVPAEVVAELVMPLLSGPELSVGEDTRDALADLLLQTARAHGAKKPVIALVEERDSDSGVAEYDDLTRHLKARGLDAVVGDVRDLRLHGDELRLKGRRVDVIYRDTEVQDVVRWRAQAEAARAM